MNRKLVLAACAATFALVFFRCSPAAQDAGLSLTATPRSIAGDGTAESTIKITATDESGMEGTGSVHLSSVAGSLAAGTDVTLASGTGEVKFSCNAATDAKCTGNVRILATWVHAGKDVQAQVNVSVTGSTDGGGTGGGAGGGGGGSGGSAGDGGTTTHRLVLAPSKPSLVTGTGDTLVLTATLTLSATAAPVSNTNVSFTTTSGALGSGAGGMTATAMTDAAGVATTTLFVSSAATGLVTVTASALSGMATARINFVAVSGITYQTDARTKPVLGIQSSGRDTSTQIYFKVIDAAQRGVPGVAVNYRLEQGGAAGAMVSPLGTTDDGGVTFATLTSGDGVGIATVHATIAATADAGSPVETTHPGTPIVGGKPSDRGLVFDCPKKNLGALHQSGALPPTRSVQTACNLDLADRFGNPVGIRTPVQFFSERGTMTSPVDSAISGGNVGRAVSTHNTLSNALPVDVTPVAGEPDLGSNRNPRDMLVTIIAVVSGEESFSDGSGSGQMNGTWERGEWFVDLPEPFVDTNDNNIYDPGEQFIDTDRLNCTSGQVEPKNNMWDGPNGCWDSNTQIWATTHVEWTGPLIGPLTFSPSGPPPFTIPAGSVVVYQFNWADNYGSPLSVDAPTFSVMQTGANIGMVSIMAPGALGESLGFTPVYALLEATESAAGSGMFTINGPCNTMNPAPGPLTRCIHRVSFSSFGAGNAGTLTFTGKARTADGGFPPPVSGTMIMTSDHSFSTPVQRSFTVNY